VPLSFARGEAYQFDWSHEIVLIKGVTVTCKVAHVRLCHSRRLFVRVLSALAPAGGYQSSWGTLLLVLGGMKRDAVPSMSINGRQASV
jgi:hypothetical protein